VRAVGTRLHVEHRPDRDEIEFAIEMRKQFIVARGLPAQRVAQHIRVNLDQEQPLLAEKVLPRGLADLRSGREMNEAVARVIGAAAIDASPFSLAPGGRRANFVNRTHESWIGQLEGCEPVLRTVSVGTPELKAGQPLTATIGFNGNISKINPVAEVRRGLWSIPAHHAEPAASRTEPDPESP